LTVLETRIVGAGQRDDAGGDVRRDAADGVARELDLARVQPGADLEPEIRAGGGGRVSAGDRPRRAVEDGH
jgi:hypothetical protein